MQSVCRWVRRSALLFAVFSALAPGAGAQYREIGLANYYADYLQGKTTAYGEIYDAGQYTCAHRTHAPGTMLRVTRLDNGTSVTVRVNDKGAFSDGFVVSLSRVAAQAIGLEQSGRARVQVDIVAPVNTFQGESITAPASYSDDITARSPASSPARLAEKVAEPTPGIPTSRVLLNGNEVSPGAPVQNTDYGPVPPQVRPSQSTVPGPAVYSGDQVSGTTATSAVSAGKITRISPGFGGYGVQTGAFSSYDNAERQAAAMLTKGVSAVFILEVREEGKPTVYRLIAGNFQTRIEAERYLVQVRDGYKLPGFVINM